MLSARHACCFLERLTLCPRSCHPPSVLRAFAPLAIFAAFLFVPASIAWAEESSEDTGQSAPHVSPSLLGEQEPIADEPSVASTDDATAVGDTITEWGFIYEITSIEEKDGFAGEVVVAGFDSTADAFYLSAVVRNNYHAKFLVTGVKDGALDGFSGDVRVNSLEYAQGKASMDSVLPAFSSNANILLLMAENHVRADASSASVDIDGTEFSVAGRSELPTLVFMEGGFTGAKLENVGSIGLPYYIMDDDGVLHEYTLAPGAVFDSALLDPFVSTVSYSINGAEHVEAPLAKYAGWGVVKLELPAGTPLDARVNLDLSNNEGIAQGFQSTSWEGNRADVVLENGKASIDVDLFSTLAENPLKSPTTIIVEVPQSNASVWVDGKRYDEAFSSDEMSLEYGEDGTPVLTLDGVRIDQVADRGSSEVAAIASSGDLTIKVASSSLILVDGSVMYSEAIAVDGVLRIEAAEPGDEPSLFVDYTYGGGGHLASVVAGDQGVEVAGVTLAIECASNYEVPLMYAVESKESSVSFESRGSGLVVNSEINNNLTGVKAQGAVTFIDAKVDIAGGGITSAVEAGGDISVSGRTIMEVAAAPYKVEAALYSSEGTITLDCTAASRVHVSASNGNIPDGTPLALLAKDVIVEDGSVIVAPEDGDVSNIELKDWSENTYTMKTISGEDGFASEVLVASGESVELAGKTIGEVFPSEAFASLVWKGVLEKEDPYDKNYVFTAADSQAISAADSLTLEGVSSSEINEIDFSPFKGIDYLTIKLAADNQTGADKIAQLDFSAFEDNSVLRLSGLDIHVEGVEELSISGEIESEYLSVSEDRGGSGALRTLSIADEISSSRVDLLQLSVLSEVLLGQNPFIEELRAIGCFALERLDVAALPGLKDVAVRFADELKELALPQGVERFSAWDVPSLQMDVSRLTNLTSLVLWDAPMESLDLSSLHGLQGFSAQSMENLESVVFASDAPLTDVSLYKTNVASLVLPETAQLSVLDVSENNLESLVIPEASRKALQELDAYGNRLATLDLSGARLDSCLLVDAYGEGVQEVTFSGREQADGSVVVSLEALEGWTIDPELPQGATYDAAAGRITFASAEDAAAGFVYRGNTGGLVMNEDGSGEYDEVYLAVNASIDVEPYSPGGEGPGTDGGGSSGNGGASSGEESGGHSDKGSSSVFAATNDNGTMLVFVLGFVATAAFAAIGLALRQHRLHR